VTYILIWHKSPTFPVECLLGFVGCSLAVRFAGPNLMGPPSVTVARQLLGFYELCWVSLEQLLGFNMFVGLLWSCMASKCWASTGLGYNTLRIH